MVHRSGPCFEVDLSFLPDCDPGDTPTCYRQLDGGTATRVTDAETGGYNHNLGAQIGGFDFTNSDGVGINIQVAGTGAFSDTGSSWNVGGEAFYLSAEPGESITMTITLDQNACISGSVGVLWDDVTANFAASQGIRITERPTSAVPLTITNNETTSVDVTGQSATSPPTGQGLYNGLGQETVYDITLSNDAGSATRNSISFSIYTNPNCVYKYWQQCDVGDDYVNIHDHGETTSSIGSYFQVIPCSEVPSVP